MGAASPRGIDGWGLRYMRRDWTGLALALGLQCTMSLPAGAQQHADTEAPLRFVADPSLIRQIDPAIASGRGFVTTIAPAAPAAPAAALAPPQTPPLPTAAAALGSPQRPLAPSWPVTLHEVHAERAARGKTETWAPAEVQAARASCARILKEINGVAEQLEPIRVGSCGAPAPIKLISLGRKPEVVLSPAATVTCEMAETLHKWITTGLQPLARQHLGAPIIKIEKMSDYSCRNAYGRARGRLSEHGRANALDIAGFVTASGSTATLLADWGMTERDVRQQIAAARKEAEKADAVRLAAERAGQRNARDTHRANGEAPANPPPAAVGIASGAPAGGIVRPTLVEGADGGGERPAITFSIAGGNGETPVKTPLDGMIGRLGGNVPRQGITTGSIVRQTGGVGVKGGPMMNDVGKARFLRGAHETACKLFGTVLGPEANNAHRNHLHIDMAERGARGPFCE